MHIHIGPTIRLRYGYDHSSRIRISHIDLRIVKKLRILTNFETANGFYNFKMFNIVKKILTHDDCIVCANCNLQLSHNSFTDLSVM